MQPNALDSVALIHNFLSAPPGDRHTRVHKRGHKLSRADPFPSNQVAARARVRFVFVALVK